MPEVVETSPEVDHTRWQRTDHHKRDGEVVPRMDHRGHTHHEQVGMDRQEVDGPPEQEAENDNLRGESSNRREEGVNDDDNHHGEDYTHGVEVVRARNIHRKAGNRLDGMVEATESGNDHYVGFRLESVKYQEALYERPLG